MRRIALVSAVVLNAALWVPGLEACGDKFLVVGRGTSFRLAYASVYPGDIVVYLPGDQRATERAAGLSKILARAGHRVSIVVEAETLAETVRRRGVDIVIADIAEAGAVGATLNHGVAEPTAVYVGDAKNGTGRPGAPRPALVLNPTEKAMKVLKVIEEAMKSRAQAGIRVRRA